MSLVRDAFFDVLRRFQMTTIFSNPGSTEIPLLTQLPDDLTFVLCLHEASVVGAATGWSLGTDIPGVALLHTTAGLGNAVGAIATARMNRVPLVVIVGQQDRRHLAHEPFLTGKLEGLAGEYPVWTGTPARAADVPALVARAHHEATISRGPALVVVPMDDWLESYDEAVRPPAPLELKVAGGADDQLCSLVAERVQAARNPVMLVGAGADYPRTWDALAHLAEALQCPVWQEPFGARAGFPQDSARFAGHLPAGRAGVREALDQHDLVLVVGAAAVRQYGYEEGALFGTHAQVVVLTDDPSEAARSVADLAVLTPLPDFCTQLAKNVKPPVEDRPQAPARSRTSPTARRDGFRAEDVFTSLRERLPADAVVVEESPSTRLQLQETVPARSPLGFLSAAMGGLGFGMPAAMGLKMGDPTRPVVGVIGDGSSMYSFQALWTAQHYGVGVVYLVLSNGGYAIMDELAEREGGRPPWPSFGDIDVDALAAAMNCPSVRVTHLAELERVLDETLPTLPSRTSPLLINVVVQR